MKINMDKLKKLDNVILVDCRNRDEALKNKVKNAILLEEAQQFDLSQKNVVLFDRKGEIDSSIIKNAYTLEGGYFSIVLDSLHQKKEDFYLDAEKSIIKKFRPKIWSKFTKALKEYKLVNEGDCIGVCISGGKDSMLMAKCFQELHAHTNIPFDVKYIVMDPGYDSQNRMVIEENAKALHIPIEIFESDIFENVVHIDKSPCYICARMRRGHLYNFAKNLGCNKIALGHHYDDVIETILMGMLYGGQIQTMMPKLHATNFKGMEIIRPLYFIREEDIISWTEYNDLHFIQCACKFTEESTVQDPGLSKRKVTKEIIKHLKKENPYVEANIFKSVENVNLTTIIAYKDDTKRTHFLDDYDEKEG